MAEITTRRRFAVDDRVVALEGTDWDEHPPNDSIYRFGGHYGKVVATCYLTGAPCHAADVVHVRFYGTIDGRGNDTFWTGSNSGTGDVWHCYAEEIEHAD